eukprot:COSAG02_NODE_358_length_23882_cov_25.508683_6_plen_120_part_00
MVDSPPQAQIDPFQVPMAIFYSAQVVDTGCFECTYRFYRTAPESRLVLPVSWALIWTEIQGGGSVAFPPAKCRLVLSGEYPSNLLEHDMALDGSECRNGLFVSTIMFEVHALHCVVLTS